MQRVTLLCVGKPAGFYAEGIREYEKRLGAFCRFEAAELPEEALNEKNASPRGVEVALEKEGTRLLAALPKKAQLWALCVEGKPLTSEEFAQMLEQNAREGGDVALVVGSSHGLSPAVKQAAQRKISLSAMTLPHQLARLMLTEQLYRAFQIRAGGRYHK